jgi:hypothetical protein
LPKKREKEDEPERVFNYGAMCYASALRAFESLAKDGHSGMSIGFTKQILNRLIDGKPLTPIEDTEDMWSECWKKEDSSVTYQCKRMGSLFKDVYEDGTVKYQDTERAYCINISESDAPYYNGFNMGIYNELFPITMPYMPEDGRDVIICDELLTDPKNDDYDTKAILYVKRANGERIDINRYFKETDDGFEEISEEEYREREKMDEERRNLT